MRIQHNIMAMNSYRNLAGNNSALSKNLEKLSSGYKVNRAGDDAAGLAISEKLRAQITGLKQAQDNAKSGISLVQTAEGALTEVHSMLNRMVKLATQASNGTYSTTERGKLEDEVSQLKSEIDRIANTTKFGDKVLLSSAKTFTFFFSDNANDSISIALSSACTQAGLGISGISVASSTAAAQAVATAKTAIDTVSSIRSKLGAVQNRLEHTINNLAVATENIQDAESVIRDTDVAEEMMAYTKNNILIQSAQAMLAQANQVPQGVLQLMQ